ncbi:hypothetical protein PIB30_073516 [Stylosanthes scabra]|uniref:Uncharacterized protein n=1 Tax=Stylosanthes scabra TaxID=79078 RepID=A0ABU6YS23_9FABA|nr:hypothetical protein [Stylosanthes scabra]
MGIVVERDSCNSSGSAFAASSIIKDVNVIKTYDFRDGNSIEQPTKKKTSEVLGEKLIDLEAQTLMLSYHELKVLIENLERKGAESHLRKQCHRGVEEEDVWDFVPKGGKKGHGGGGEADQIAGKSAKKQWGYSSIASEAMPILFPKSDPLGTKSVAFENWQR